MPVLFMHLFVASVLHCSPAMVAVLHFENDFGAAGLFESHSSFWGGAACLVIRRSILGGTKGRLLFPGSEKGKLRILLEQPIHAGHLNKKSP